MATSKFQTSLSITYVGTATAIIDLGGLTILTDPYFSPAGTEWVATSAIKLVSSYEPALKLHDLPPIDLVLLSHEDHKDNLDDLGRQLLDGRRVVTTVDGARNLAPRPGIHGMRPWETLDLQFNGLKYTITAAPCKHLPGGECIGFVLTADHFGTTDAKPNAIYFSGDTVYQDELAQIRDKFHVSVALFCLGKAMVPQPDGSLLRITMNGQEGVRLMRAIGADLVIPLHFEGWSHFKESSARLEATLREESVEDKFMMLSPGKSTKIF